MGHGRYARKRRQWVKNWRLETEEFPTANFRFDGEGKRPCAPITNSAADDRPLPGPRPHGNVSSLEKK